MKNLKKAIQHGHLASSVNHRGGGGGWAWSVWVEWEDVELELAGGVSDECDSALSELSAKIQMLAGLTRELPRGGQARGGLLGGPIR